MKRKIPFVYSALLSVFFALIMASTTMALIGVDDTGHKKTILSPDMEKDPGLFFLLGKNLNPRGTAKAC